jgi:hypothetical protein
MKHINIALDWDGTCDLDQDLWFEVVKLIQARGHKVYVITMSYPSECTKISEAWYKLLEGRVIPTSRLAKKKFVQKMNLPIHIWIDDHPLALYLDAREAFGTVDPEGLVREVSNYQHCVDLETNNEKGVVSVLSS